MPRLNDSGSALMGVAGGLTSVDGSTPTALVGSTGGGWVWFNATTIIGQALIPSLHATEWRIYQLTPLSAAAATLVSTEGANSIAAGGGVWEKWWTNGITTNVVAVPSLPSAGIGAVDWDGTWAVQTLYSSASGITVYAKIGTVLNQLPVSLSSSHAPNPIVFRDGMLAYPTLTGWQLTNAESGLPVSGYVQQVGTTVMIPIIADGVAVVVEYNAPLSQWTIRKADSGTGLIVATGNPFMFNMDAIYLGGNIFRLAWSTGAGELPSELVVLDIDITDGTTEQGTVSGGVLVFAPGATLNGSRFDVAGSTKSYLPSQQDLVIGKKITVPWLRALQQLEGGAAGTSRTVRTLNPSSGSSTASTAQVVVGVADPGFPQGRVVTDSASVTADVSVPGVISFTATGAGIYDQSLNTTDDVQFASLTVGLAAPPIAGTQLQLQEAGAPNAVAGSTAQLLVVQDDASGFGATAGVSVLNTNYDTDTHAGLTLYQEASGNIGIGMDSETAGFYYVQTTGELQIYGTEIGFYFGPGTWAQQNTDMALTFTTPDTNNVLYDSTPLAAIYINGPGSASTRNFVSGIWCVTEGSATDKGRGIAVQNLGVSDGFYVQNEAAGGTGYAALNVAAGVGLVTENRDASATGAVFRQGTGGGASVVAKFEGDIAGTAELINLSSSQTGKSGIVVRASGAGNKAMTVYNSTPAIAFDVGADDGHIYTRTYIEGVEMTAPAAPGANGGRIFFQDNGAGKTQLMCIFSSGAPQQLAIQP